MRKARSAPVAAAALTLVVVACTRPADYAPPPPPITPGLDAFRLPTGTEPSSKPAPAPAPKPEKPPPITREPDPVFPASPRLRKELEAYSIGVRDEAWAAPTERILRERGKLEEKKSGGRVRQVLAYCLTDHCLLGELLWGRRFAPEPVWSGLVSNVGALPRTDGWREVVIVLMRHVRDYPGYEPRVHSADSPSKYPACAGRMAHSCRCTCFAVERDVSQDPITPCRGCYCPDRQRGACGWSVDFLGRPSSPSMPRGYQPGASDAGS